MTSSDPVRVVDRMMSALGGRSAITALRSLAVEADCTGPEGEFVTRVESLRPGCAFFRQTEGDRTTEVWTTPERTWTTGTDGDARDLDTGVRAYVRSHEFHLLLLEFDVRFGDSRIGGHGDLISFTDENGQPGALQIDSDGVPQVLTQNPEGADGPIRIEFDDWETIDGLLYFRSFVLSEGDARTFAYRYRTLDPNGVDPARFDA